MGFDLLLTNVTDNVLVSNTNLKNFYCLSFIPSFNLNGCFTVMSTHLARVYFKVIID